LKVDVIHINLLGKVDLKLGRLSCDKAGIINKINFGIDNGVWAGHGGDVEMLKRIDADPYEGIVYNAEGSPGRPLFLKGKELDLFA